MKKLLLLAIAFYSNSAVGQTQDSIKISKHELEDIRHQLEALNNDRTASQAKKYERNFINLSTTADILKELQATIHMIESDKNTSDFNVALNEMNNPTNRVLGFSFTDKIDDLLDQQIVSSAIQPDKANIIKGAVFNILGSFKSIFPPIQVASSIISSISTLTNSQTTLVSSNQNGKINNIKDLKNLTNTAVIVDEKFVAGFAEKLSPYVKFYQDLDNINTSYKNELDRHSAEFDSVFHNKFKNAVTRFQVNTGITINASTNNTLQVISIMDYGNSGRQRFSYASYNQSPAIVYLNSELENIYDLMLSFNEYATDYDRILKAHVANSKNVLIDARGKVGDQEKVNQLIERIQKSYEGKGSNQGFKDKYKEKIAEINAKIRKVRTE